MLKEYTNVYAFVLQSKIDLFYLERKTNIGNAG